jgi:hypothetical protein
VIERIPQIDTGAVAARSRTVPSLGAAKKDWADPATQAV